MSAKKRGLGRGLDALLGSVAPPVQAEVGEELRELELELLAPGRHQPRRKFDPEALQSLADSIRSQGVVQPIVARPAGNGRFEIVAGERRWRAAKMAGLKTVPTVVRQIPDRTAMAVALVENIQRSDLNPLEEAEALRRLIDECGLTHELTAEAVGRSRAAVSNLLRLLDLEAEVQALVRDDKLSLGHAKVLLAVDGQRQVALARQVVEQQLSVRQTEQLVAHKAADKTPARAAAAKGARSPLELQLSERVGLPVHLKQSRTGRGQLTIGFGDKSELERLLKLFG
ncbi:MAG: ParB/RepB/Spo0J family partition protein [Nevskia sp.]|nr:ParB/RepB/Spo0J family partition protein [Nevskia sp.]